jgi:hypothetical protein
MASGNNNIAIGNNAGSQLVMGSNDIYIGAVGSGTESNVTRIGSSQGPTYIAGLYDAGVSSNIPVYVALNGQVGTQSSSRRFKSDVRDMAAASDAIFALRPVKYRYKPEYDPTGWPQYGLVAEEVEKVCRDLVAYDAAGKPYTVRYEAVDAMLLNEFLKEHRKVQEQQAKLDDQAAAISKLESAVAKLAVSVNEQRAEIEKVSAQSRAGRPAEPIAAIVP